MDDVKCMKTDNVSDFELIKEKIAKIMRSNILAIFIGVLVLLSCIAATILIINRITDTVAAYRRFSKPTSNDIVDDDYYNYTQTSYKDDLPQPSEFSILINKMNKIKGKYHAYNTAISNHLNESGREVDAVIDENILSSQHDDYKY